jgi:hypothetical protein
MTYIKVNETLIPAEINGYTTDRGWNNRESKAITVEMTYTEADKLFVDGLAWSIVMDVENEREDGEVVVTQEEYDNSDFCVAGSITDNRNGTITAKMGKPTEVEIMQAQLANAVTEEELETAYMEGVNSL